MSMLGEQLCRECRSPLIDDMQNGETICSGCGIVASSHAIDYGPESNTTDHEEKIRLARATGINTYARHDLGVTTTIDPSSKDFSGRSIDRRIANQMTNLRTWQKRIRVSSPLEKRRVSVLSVMGMATASLGLPKTVLETASVLYRNIDSQINIKGRSTEAIVAAILYMACKKCGIVRSIDEIARSTGPASKAKVKLAARYYRTMMMETNQAGTPGITLDKYISKYANMAQVDAKVERLALNMAAKTRNAALTAGKSPHGVASAYLYMASVILGYGMPQREISSVSNVTEVTIRNRCREILTKYRFVLTLQPSAAARARR